MLAFRRGLSSAAQARPLQSVVEESISRLPNGMTVASVDLRGAVSQLVLAFRAGSRYEQVDEAGLVHHLRNCVGIDSAKYLGVKMLWQSGSIGANLLSTASKDILALHMSVCRTYANVGLSLLGEFAQPAFKEWDVEDVSETLEIDLAQQSPLELVVENLHKNAYREGPLGNSILAPSHRIGKISNKQLGLFAKSRLVTSEAVLVGINIDHSSLLDYSSHQGSISQESSGGKPGRDSPYIGGGEMRVSANTPLVHVAIAGQGARLTDLKSVAVQSVLAAVIGRGQNLKFTNSPGFGVVSKQVFKAANHHKVGVNALNIVHSDGGLAGVYIVAEGDKAAPYVKAAVAGLKELASSAPDAETLSIAKKLTEVETHVNAESSAGLAIDQAAQILANGSVASPSEFIKAVQEVSGEDIKKAAARILEKPSISSYGKINQVPHVDQL